MAKTCSIGGWALLLVLGTGGRLAAESAPDLSWRKAVQTAEAELRENVAGQVTDETVAKELQIPWPLAETSTERAVVEKAISEKVTARLDAEIPIPDDEALDKIAAEVFPVWKVGDQVEFEDRRGRKITGRLLGVYPGSIKISGGFVSIGDLDARTLDHLDEKKAEKRRAFAREQEMSRVQEAREGLRASVSAGLEEEVFKENGYFEYNGRYVSPVEARAFVQGARFRKIAWETRKQAPEFMTRKGFVPFEGEWVPAAVRQAAMARIAKEREAEKADLAQFARGGGRIAERDIGQDMKNLVLITVKTVDGGEAAASGFILRKGFRKCVVTNQHVFMKAKSFTLRTPAGVVLKPKSIEFASTQDLALIAFTCPPGIDEPEGFALTLMDPAIGDQIVVLGNSQGAGVVTKEPGGVLGVGPDLVEVDAGFVAGNSGSPILNAAGKVVGVATFATREDPEWVTQDSRYQKVRRFGVRLRWDAFPECSLLDWRQFVTDSYTLTDYQHYLDDLFRLMTLDIAFMKSYQNLDPRHWKKYKDQSLPNHILFIVNDLGLLRALSRGYTRDEILKVFGNIETLFQRELNTVRASVASRKWETSSLAEEAEIVDLMCTILQQAQSQFTAIVSRALGR